VKIAIGSDHAGFRYKERIRALLAEWRHDVADLGTYSPEPVDYPCWIRPVAEGVARKEFERGIVLGGSGNGEAIVANRVQGVRCTLCWNVESARYARLHNDANVLAIGERLVPEDGLASILEVWLTTPFEGGRHLRRIQQIDADPACDTGAEGAGEA
jgi:ribose 5-phosphate isomerase B